MAERIPNGLTKRVAFRAILASDHFTPATGKTIVITISKNGGAFGNPNAGATNATEISSGFYKVTLDTTDTGTNGPLLIRGAAATIDDVGAIYQVGQSPADVTHLLGTAWLTPGTAGTPDVNVKLWNALAAVALPLIPTTAGRTLDVSAGGEAGVDWANVGSPTTAVNLSATNIDPDQVVASVVGAVGSVSGAVGSVTGAVGSVTGAVGSVTGNVGGNVVGSVASVVGAVGSVTGAVGSVTGAVGSVTGAVGSVTGAVGSVAAGGITASSIATDAIDADALATDAVTEITNAILALTIETGLTLKNALRLIAAASAGKLSGADASAMTMSTISG